MAGTPAKTFVLDAKKNTLNNGRGVFAYDLKNNLVQATVNGVVSTYAFDALNQRVSKTVGGVVTRFIYDEAGNLAGEYDAAGAMKAEHIYLGALPVGVRMNGSAHRVHTDYLGTPRAVSLGSTIVWKWPSSDPFGGNAPSISAIVYNPRFPGQYFDAESGLHHNKHRAYDPSLGRYMQPDPLGLAAGKNPFNYVNQNPLNGIDREGLIEEGKGKYPSSPLTGSKLSDGVYSCYARLGSPTEKPAFSMISHAYSCVVTNGKEICKGLVPDGFVGGTLVQEIYSTDLCEKVSDDSRYGACVEALWNRGNASWGFSWSCQGYNASIHHACSSFLVKPFFEGK